MCKHTFFCPTHKESAARTLLCKSQFLFKGDGNIKGKSMQSASNLIQIGYKIRALEQFENQHAYFHGGHHFE